MTVQQPYARRTYVRRGLRILTSANLAARADALAVYTMLVQLGSPEPSKEELILRFVSRFKQLTTKQIKALVYPGQPHEPQRRAVGRLTRNKLLAIVKQPHHASARGGREMNVYQLGTEGKAVLGVRRRNAVVVDYHALTIANVYIALAQAERDGHIKIIHYATEPDSHTEVGTTFLKPDLYLDVAIRAVGKRRAYWFEIDMGTERQKQVLDQVAAYNFAHGDQDKYPLELYPRVVFLATSDERVSEIRYWLQRAGQSVDYPIVVGRVNEVLTILQHK